MSGYDYHFIAIGGIGQSALAKILLGEGYSVSGSDISHSKYVLELEKLGAKVFIGHSEDNIIGNPCIVLSTAIKEDNPELIKARKLGLKIIHRSDLLAEISRKYPCFIGFSGTHGKTTTSGLCSYLLSKAGKKPAFAIGGIIPEINTNGDCEEKYTPYFVAELDESDGTILKYQPKITVVNNLEADHFDFYTNGLDDILKTFGIFLSNLKSDSKVIINVDNSANCELISQNQDKKFITFGIKADADYSAKNIQYFGLGSKFDVFKNDKLICQIQLSIPGEHNVYNALAVCVALIEAGFEIEEFLPHFLTFSGMGRRFQKVAEFNSITIVDDYAHHPSEIKATLNAVLNVESRKVAIFQPHRYSRFVGLYDDFLSSFENADVVFVLDVYAAGEDKISSPNVKDFAKALEKMGKKAQQITGSIQNSAQEIFKYLQKGDLVFTFGAGDITKMGSYLNEQYLKNS